MLAIASIQPDLFNVEKIYTVIAILGPLHRSK